MQWSWKRPQSWNSPWQSVASVSSLVVRIIVQFQKSSRTSSNLASSIQQLCDTCKWTKVTDHVTDAQYNTVQRNLAMIQSSQKFICASAGLIKQTNWHAIPLKCWRTVRVHHQLHEHWCSSMHFSVFVAGRSKSCRAASLTHIHMDLELKQLRRNVLLHARQCPIFRHAKTSFSVQDLTAQYEEESENSQSN